MGEYARDSLYGESTRRGLATELFGGGHLSRDELLGAAKRMVQMLEVPKLSLSENSRGRRFDEEAKALMRFATGDPNIGSTSSESQCMSTEDDDRDANFCEELFDVGAKR